MPDIDTVLNDVKDITQSICVIFEDLTEETTKPGKEEKARELVILFHKYLDKKQELKIMLIGVAVINNNQNKQMLKEILKRKYIVDELIGKLLLGNIKISEEEKEYFLRDAMSIDSLLYDDQLVSDKFYSWFGPADYLERAYEIGILILDVENLPSFLSDYIFEIKQCYGFGCYIAVVALCRAILEICVYDIHRRREERQHNKKLHEQEARGDTVKATARILFGNGSYIYIEFKKLYGIMCCVVHGNLFPFHNNITQDTSREYFKRSLDIIHLMYEHQ